MNSLKGHLLIASPDLDAPFFTRTVILMLEHGAEGALGVVINRPTEATVTDIAQKIFEDEPFEWDKTISLGGPVAGPLMVIHTDEEQADPLKFLQSALGNVGAADLTALPEHNFSAGRQLTFADAGQPVMVIGENRFLTAAGIGVGDKLTFAVNSGDEPSAASGDAPSVTFEGRRLGR